MMLAAARRSARPWLGWCECTSACARLPRKPTCFRVRPAGGESNAGAAGVLLLACSSSAVGGLMAVHGDASLPMAGEASVCKDASAVDVAPGDAVAMAGDAVAMAGEAP